MKNLTLGNAVAVLMLSTLAFGAVTPSHGSTELETGGITSVETHRDQFSELIGGSELSEVTQYTVMQLFDEAIAVAGDRARLLTTTEEIARALLDDPQQPSVEFVQATFSVYENALAQVTKLEVDVRPSTGKCNDDFQCKGFLGICVVITWNDGNGSGGINCISPSLF